MTKFDKILQPALTEAQIIDAVTAKRPGTWRYVKWVSEETTFGGRVITVVKAGWFAVGIKYDHKKDVIAMKKAEDEALGAPATRRASSYVRPVGTDGNPIDPFFIVRDRSTQTKKYLQVFPAKMWDIRTKTVRPMVRAIYKDGELIQDELLISAIEKKLKKRGHSGPINTFVVKLNNILEIK